MSQRMFVRSRQKLKKCCHGGTAGEDVSLQNYKMKTKEKKSLTKVLSLQDLQQVSSWLSLTLCFYGAALHVIGLDNIVCTVKLLQR